jgi:hypothetical protein
MTLNRAKLCHYTGRLVLLIVMLNVIMLSVIMPNVVMLSVVAPYIKLVCSSFRPQMFY